MNREGVASVALAACCLFALGTAAATLDSTVDTTPDDVIDFEAGSLPLPSDDVSTLKRQIQSDSAGKRPEGRSDPAQRGEAGPQHPERGDTGPKQPDLQPGRGSQRGSDADDTGDPSLVPSGEGDQPGPSPAGRDLLDWLLGLLAELLELLLALLPVVVLAGVVALAVRYRDRLRARLARLGPSRRAPDEAPPRPSPSNEVTAAWFEMVRRAGLADETSRTPRQCESEAIEAGADADVVRSLTSTFEEVAYGGAPVTDQRRSRARRDIERIRGQLEGQHG